MIEIQTSPEFANRVINHPHVRPFVGELSDERLDIGALIKSGNCLVLGGKHGVFVLFKFMPGVWEIHSAVLPEGRGEWAHQFANEALHLMFTGTDCIEILTRIPHGHIAAKALAQLVGFRLSFTGPDKANFRGKEVPIYVYSLTLQDWMIRAPGLDRVGARFHEWLNRNIEGLPHEIDPDHNRLIGAVTSMLLAGFPGKALGWYNRWALSVRHPIVRLISEDPVKIAFDAGVLVVENGEMSLEPPVSVH